MVPRNLPLTPPSIMSDQLDSTMLAYLNLPKDASSFNLLTVSESEVATTLSPETNVRSKVTMSF